MKKPLVEEYFNKMRGCTTSQNRPCIIEAFWSFVGALAGIGAVAYLHCVSLGGEGQPLLIGSFGASAVLLYGAPAAALSQPRNLLGGHFLSALVGVFFAGQLGAMPWLASALAVATAIFVMHLSGTLHPPGGATALIAVIGGAPIHELGYFYAFIPVLGGAMVLLLVALLVNNIPKSRRYPQYWL